MPIAVGVVAVSAFVMVYLGIYRPLLSHPDPGGMGETISVVKSVRLKELDALVSEEMSYRMALGLTTRERKTATRERRHAISVRLMPVEADVRLFLAFARRRALQIRSRDPRTYTEQEWLLQELFQRAQTCCLILTFAKAVRSLMPWDVQRLINFHRDTVMKEVRELMVLFLRLSATYGEWHRENLLAALEAWELAGENI